jgi:ATP-dependent DNA helicase 2 subunit 2
MVNLQKKCVQDYPGNKEFWSELGKIGREISLISNKEAKQHGGTASVSEGKADSVSLSGFILYLRN